MKKLLLCFQVCLRCPKDGMFPLFSNKRVFTSNFHTFSFFASFFYFWLVCMYYFFSPRCQENLGSGAYEKFIAGGDKKETNFSVTSIFFWRNIIWAETYECGWDEKKACFKTVLWEFRIRFLFCFYGLRGVGEGWCKKCLERRLEVCFLVSKVLWRFYADDYLFPRHL